MAQGEVRVELFRAAHASKGRPPLEVRRTGVQTYHLRVDGTDRGPVAVDLDADGVAGIAAEVKHQLQGRLDSISHVTIATDAGEAHAVDWLAGLGGPDGPACSAWIEEPAGLTPSSVGPLEVRVPAGGGVDLEHLRRVLDRLEQRWGGVDGSGFSVGAPHDTEGVVWLAPAGTDPRHEGAVRIAIHLGSGPRYPKLGTAGVVAEVEVESGPAATAFLESLFVTVYKDFLPLPAALVATHAWQWSRQRARLRMSVSPAFTSLRVVRIPPWPGQDAWHLGWAKLYPGRWEASLLGRAPGPFAGLHTVVGPSGSGRTSFVEASWLPSHTDPTTGERPGYNRIRLPSDFQRFFSRLAKEDRRQVAIIDGVTRQADPRLEGLEGVLDRAGERGAVMVVGTGLPEVLESLRGHAPLRLTLPDRNDLIRVLRAPAEQLGYTFEAGVLEAIVDDVIARAPADRLREASERLRFLWDRIDGFVFSTEAVAGADARRQGLAVASLASDRAFDASRDARSQDQLEFWRHIEAFTSLVLSRQTRLPLSVGLFGDWGSGKSFFMRSLSQALVERADAVRAAEDAPSEEAHWYGRVVPIHFNAWHFADSDLWASLVHHLFRELGAWLADEEAGRQAHTEAERQALAEAERERAHLSMLQRLHTTQQRVKEASAARDAVRARLDAQQARRESALRQGLLGLKHAAMVFVTDIKTDVMDTDPKAVKRPLTPDERTDVERMVKLTAEADAVRTLLGERAPGNVDEVEQLVQDWTGSQRAFRYVSWLVRGPRPWARLGFMLGLLGVAYLFHNLVDFLTLQSSLCSAQNGGPWYCGALAPTASTLVWMASTTASTYGLFRSWLQRTAPGLWTALSHPEVFEQRLDRFHQLLPRFKADRRAAERELAEADAAVSAARRQLQEAEQAVHEAQSGVALHRFVTDGVGDRYRSHLGLMATIDEDLHQLGEILHDLELDYAVARKKQEGDPEPDRARLTVPPPPRIVLFIDDLDRCPPERVVDVLEAVHLLLAKDLFVVVVAVDARWLMRSVDTHFRNLVETAHDHQHQRAGDPLRVATPRHYLEKIFQVPFQVPPMTSSGYSRMVDRLVGDVHGDSAPVESAQGTGPAGDAAPVAAPAPASPPVQVSTVAEAPAPIEPEAAVAATADAPAEETPPTDLPPRRLPEATHVRFTPLERDVLRALAPLVRTPRSTKRLVNTARLVRLHAGTDPDWDALCPIAFLLLALEVGAWETWVAARKRLIRSEFAEPLGCLDTVATTSAGHASGLTHTLQYLSHQPGLSDDPRRWRRAMGLSERYAFVLDGGHTREADTDAPGARADG